MADKHPGGRPPKEINWKQVEEMCKLQCTGEEIAAVLGIHYETLNNKVKELGYDSFPDYFAEKRQAGKASLRRMQFKHAENNPIMAIFLGKNLLNQSDKQEIVNHNINSDIDDLDDDQRKAEIDRLLSLIKE